MFLVYPLSFPGIFLVALTGEARRNVQAYFKAFGLFWLWSKVYNITKTSQTRDFYNDRSFENLGLETAGQ